MKIEIVHIGDELLTGEINPYPEELIQMVRRKSAEVNMITIVKDDYQDIMRVMESAYRSGVDILVLTGGLGPTIDDITRQVVADFLGVELVVHEPAVEWFVEAIVRMHGVRPVMTEANMLMTMIPEGSKALKNITGAACGIEARKGDMLIFCLPGFPREMLPMFERYVLPNITGQEIYEKEIRGKRGESTMAPLFREIVRKYNVRIASLPTERWVEEGNRIIIKGRDRDEVERAAEELTRMIEESVDEFEMD